MDHHYQTMNPPPPNPLIMHYINLPPPRPLVHTEFFRGNPPLTPPPHYPVLSSPPPPPPQGKKAPRKTQTPPFGNQLLTEVYVTTSI